MYKKAVYPSPSKLLKNMFDSFQEHKFLGVSSPSKEESDILYFFLHNHKYIQEVLKYSLCISEFMEE